MGLKAGTAIAGFCTRHGLPPPSVRALQDFACECSAHLAEVSVLAGGSLLTAAPLRADVGECGQGHTIQRQDRHRARAVRNHMRMLRYVDMFTVAAVLVIVLPKVFGGGSQESA